jgi:hypothetical protein
MTLRNHSTMRTIVLSLLLAGPLAGLGCWQPDLKDAEIGCGVDANASPKCPNRPPVDAGPPTPDASGEVGPDGGPLAPDTGAKPDTTPALPDSGVDQATIVDAPPADSAIDKLALPDSAVDQALIVDAPSADSAVDKPAAVDADGKKDVGPASDATVD